MNSKGSSTLGLFALIALGAIGVAGNISPFILPIIVGGVVDHLALNIQQASYIAFSDMAGLGIGTLIWSAIITKANWRLSGAIAILLVVVSNLISAQLDTLIPLLVVRFFAGLGAGLLLAITNSGLSHAKDPDRVVGIYMCMVLLFATLALYAFPHLLDAKGVGSMFNTIALVTLALGILVVKIPTKISHSSTTTMLDSEQQKSKLATRVLASLGVLAFFFAASLVWVYMERMGRAAGFSTDEIAFSLSVSQVFGALGAIAAAVLSTRLGNRWVPMFFAVVLAVLGCLILVTDYTPLWYAVAACAIIFAWDLIYPYVIGMLSVLDSTARLVSISIAMMAAGKALSPVYGSFVLTDESFTVVAWSGAVFFFVSFLLFMPGLIFSDKRLKKVKGEPSSSA